MMEVGNFTSVFEISFALNALLYFFEVLPLQRKKDSVEIQNNEMLFEELATQGFKGLDRKPFIDGMREYQRKLERSITAITMFNSIVSLGLLVSVGFCPELELAWYFLVIILTLLFLLPLPLYLVSVKYRKLFNTWVIGRVIKRTDKEQENA